MAKKRSRKKPKVKSLMHTDIKELPVARKLRALGEIRVTDWEFSDVLPAFREMASREVNLEGFIQHAANYRVFEWGGAKTDALSEVASQSKVAAPAEIETAVSRARALLHYLVVQLCEHPEQASLRVRDYHATKLCLLVMLPNKEVSALVGHGGHTAAAIRGLIQDMAQRAGFVMDLKIIAKDLPVAEDHPNPPKKDPSQESDELPRKSRDKSKSKSKSKGKGKHQKSRRKKDGDWHEDQD